MTNLKHELRKARKEHWDDLYEDVKGWYDNRCPLYVGRTCMVDKNKHPTFSEYRSIIKYFRRENPRKIKKGEMYYHQTNTDSGQIWDWKANKEMFDIFSKYNLFDE